MAPSETPLFHNTVLGVSALLFLSAVVLWPIRAFRNRRKGIPRTTSRLTRLLAWGVSALFIVFLIGMTVVIADPTEIAFGIPPFLRYLLVLPLLAAVLMIGVLVFTVLAWKRGYWGTTGRVHYTLVMLAGLVFLWWLNHWNLLGYHLIPSH